MAKKDKPQPQGQVATDAAPLKYNPFAALAGAAPKPSAPPKPSAAPNPGAAPKPSVTTDAPAPPAATQRTEPTKARGRLVLRRETKHRGGKAVIIVQGFSALKDFGLVRVEALAKQLKQSLGCGGTVEDEGKGLEIVLQGDKAAKVAELLRAQGFRVDGVTS